MSRTATLRHCPTEATLLDGTTGVRGVELRVGAGFRLEEAGPLAEALAHLGIEGLRENEGALEAERLEDIADLLGDLVLLEERLEVRCRISRHNSGGVEGGRWENICEASCSRGVPH